MTKRHAITILWIFGAALVLYFGVTLLMSWQLARSSNDTWNAMKESAFDCPPGTAITIRGWSKAGYMRYCEPKKNGPWEAWSEGYRQIQGEYENGKENGTWCWFNRNGSIQNTVIYDSGNKLSEQRPEK